MFPKRRARDQNLLLAVASVVLAHFAASFPAVAQETARPALSATVQEAVGLLSAGNDKAALELCGDAEDLEGADRETCLIVTAVASNRSREFKDGAKAAQLLVEESQSNNLLALGYRELGIALASQLKFAEKSWPAVKPSRKALAKLERAEEALRKAMALGGDKTGATKILLADVLTARMLYDEQWEKEEEIHGILFDYLDKNPQGPSAEWARAITCTSERYQNLRISDVEPTADNEARHRTGPYYIGESVTDEMGTHKVTRPVKTQDANPEYSPLGSAAKLEGMAALQALVGKDGRVVNVRPITRLALCMTEEAVLAIQQWEFEPATLNGKPVEILYNATINFSLE